MNSLSFRTCYGDDRSFPMPEPKSGLKVGDVVSIWDLPAKAVFVMEDNGKFRANAAHHKIDYISQPQCLNWEDNLYRDAQFFIVPVNKKDGEAKLIFCPVSRVYKKAKAAIWNYRPNENKLVKIVSLPTD